MTHIFIVNGYGVPKDILKDGNYHFYLNLVFNRIWDVIHNSPQPSLTLREGEEKEFPPLKLRGGVGGVMVILSGGPTDCFTPYKRTEAGEMKKLFVQMMQRGSVRGVTKHWKVLTQTKALTTVENLVYGREIVQSRKLKVESQLNYRDQNSGNVRVFYFCEQTRAWRSEQLCRKVFPKSWKSTVVPIDFDVSPQRYLNEKLLKAREEKALQYELWALKSSKNLKAWREVYQERIEFLRRAGPQAHHEAVKEWWEKRLLNLRIPS